MVRKVVIPVAGLGTRFLPATKSLPKEMLPLLTKPTIQYIVEEAVAARLADVLFITGRHKRAIEDHFDHLPSVEAHLASRGRRDLLARVVEPATLAHVHYVRQAEPRGLGDAVREARHHVGRDAFALMLADDVYEAEPPAIAQLAATHAKTGKSIVAVQKVPLREISRYGVVSLPSGGDPLAGPVEALGFVEKPVAERAPSQWAVVGRYVLQPDIFDLLDRTKPGAGGEIQLTDALDALARNGRVQVMAIRGRRFDVGDPLGFVQATVAMGLADPAIGPELRAYVLELLAKESSSDDEDAARREAAAGR